MVRIINTMQQHVYAHYRYIIILYFYIPTVIIHRPKKDCMLVLGHFAYSLFSSLEYTVMPRFLFSSSRRISK